jgi:hypothetical protein
MRLLLEVESNLPGGAELYDVLIIFLCKVIICELFRAAPHQLTGAKIQQHYCTATILKIV